MSGEFTLRVKATDSSVTFVFYTYAKCDSICLHFNHINSGCLITKAKPGKS